MEEPGNDEDLDFVIVCGDGICLDCRSPYRCHYRRRAESSYADEPFEREEKSSRSVATFLSSCSI